MTTTLASAYTRKEHTADVPTRTYFLATRSNGPASGHSLPLLSKNFFWNDACAFSSDVAYFSTAVCHIVVVVVVANMHKLYRQYSLEQDANTQEAGQASCVRMSNAVATHKRTCGFTAPTRPHLRKTK